MIKLDLNKKNAEVIYKVVLESFQVGSKKIYRRYLYLVTFLTERDLLGLYTAIPAPLSPLRSPFTKCHLALLVILFGFHLCCQSDASSVSF